MKTISSPSGVYSSDFSMSQNLYCEYASLQTPIIMRSLFERTLFLMGWVFKITVIPAQRLVKETEKQGARIFSIGRWVIIFSAVTANEKVVKPAIELVKNELEMLNTVEKAAAYILNFAVFISMDLGFKHWLNPQWPEKVFFTILAYLLGVVAEFLFWEIRRKEQVRLWLKLKERAIGALVFSLSYSLLELYFPPVWGIVYKLYSAVSHFASRAVEEWLKRQKK